MFPRVDLDLVFHVYYWEPECIRASELWPCLAWWPDLSSSLSDGFYLDLHWEPEGLKFWTSSNPACAILDCLFMLSNSVFHEDQDKFLFVFILYLVKETNQSGEMSPSRLSADALLLPTHFYMVVTSCQEMNQTVEECDGPLRVFSFLIPHRPDNSETCNVSSHTFSRGCVTPCWRCGVEVHTSEEVSYPVQL